MNFKIKISLIKYISWDNYKKEFYFEILNDVNEKNICLQIFSNKLFYDYFKDDNLNYSLNIEHNVQYTINSNTFSSYRDEIYIIYFPSMNRLWLINKDLFKESIINYKLRRN